MSKKIEIDVFSGGRVTDPYIATDKYGRLRLSAGLVDMLSTRGMAIKLYVGFDKANKRIALGKPDVVKPTDARPLTFDAAKNYAYAGAFYHKHAIPLGYARYIYDGKYEGWLMFKREDYVAPDPRAGRSAPK